ncbi:heavy metal-binding domain-containing protein [Patiriisocius marinus]|uniref:heavy metal-binding domain-containing protein n=1 Tax=Patiriisocius marinus TaxID=1397112 RepID=UPI00232DC5B6|nr:heavy metal-binding domain-containing protein [Patiriisocius marinus]
MNFKSILVIMVLITAVTMVSCKENTTETKTQTTEKQRKDDTSVYVCPMHCKDSGSDKEGKCDTCGMALVKNEDHTGNEF